MHRDLLRLLRRAGLRFSGAGVRHLTLITADNKPRPVQVEIFPKTRLSLARAHSALRRRPRSSAVLLAATDGTERLIAEAKAGAFDLVLAEHGLVIVDGDVLLDERTSGPITAFPERRVPWQRLAVQRVLAVCARPLSQREIAERIGISQQAVSKAIKSLPRVVRTDDGWIGERGLLDAWLQDYPSPRGTQTHWYGLAPPSAQLRSARQLLTELAVGSVLTGEMAADELAPWMLPTTVRLYIDELIDFTDAGFSPTDPLDATLTVVVPEDPTIRAVAERANRRKGPASGNHAAHVTADPAIVLWDLHNTSNDPTAPEAADRLRDIFDSGRRWPS